MQHTRLNADIPTDLFVGTMDGEPSCAPDDEIYDIWPKLLVMVFLQGIQHFVIDNTAFRIDAGPPEATTPQVLMLNVARYSKLRFVNDSDLPLRKVQISAPLPWIEELVAAQPDGLPALHGFLATHLAEFRFEPDQQMLVLAEQMMEPPPSMEGEMRTLFKNARALDLIGLACSALVRSRELKNKPRLQTRQRCEQIRDYILAHLAQPLTIARIARETGVSVSWVQRHFREEFGIGVFEFIRVRRLELGRQALENEGATIAQAAHAARYSDATNFTAAFKKVFGFPPRNLRR